MYVCACAVVPTYMRLVGVSGVRRVAVWSVSLRQLLFSSKCLKPLSLLEHLCCSLIFFFVFFGLLYRTLGHLKCLVCSSSAN